MEASRKPAVAVIGTGGTIASVGGDGLELVRYIDRKQMLPVDELIARTPELRRCKTEQERDGTRGER